MSPIWSIKHAPDIIARMSMMDLNSMKMNSQSPEKTRHIGTRLGSLLQPGDVICLQGDLGAGKTTFVQGLAKGWGSIDSVSSPTFIIVNEYRGVDDRRLYHMDAYRLDSTTEAEELDLDTMLAQGTLLIEWPERLQTIIPQDHLWIRFDPTGEEMRDLNFKANGARYLEVLAKLQSSEGLK